MDPSEDAFENPDLKRLVLFVYLIPVFGLIPAAWTLSRRKSDRPHRAVSRLTLTLGGSWILGTTLLNTGLALSQAEETQGVGLSLLVLNSLLTSGYFVTCLWLMLRLWKRQSLEIPGLSWVAKYLP